MKRTTKVKAHIRKKKGSKPVVVRTHGRRVKMTRRRQKVNKILADDVTLGGVFSELVDSLKDDYKNLSRKMNRGAGYNDLFPSTATPGALEALDRSFYFTQTPNQDNSEEDTDEE